MGSRAWPLLNSWLRSSTPPQDRTRMRNCSRSLFFLASDRYHHQNDEQHQAGRRYQGMIKIVPKTTGMRIMCYLAFCFISRLSLDLLLLQREKRSSRPWLFPSASSSSPTRTSLASRPDNQTSLHQDVNQRDVVPVLGNQTGAARPAKNYSSLYHDGNDTSARDKISVSVGLIENWRDKNKKFFVYKFSSSGLGSQIMALFAKMIYFDQVHHRSVIAVETYYGYRRNETHGVLTGYFSPRFPVLDQPHQHVQVDEYLLQRQQQKRLHTTSANNSFWTLETFQPLEGKSTGPAWKGTLDHRDRVWLTSLKDHRKEIKARYKTAGPSFYELMVQYMCPHMSWNGETRQEIRQAQQQWGLPTDWDVGPSVAFHVRRTDKIDVTRKYIESRSYPGTAYVQKLLDVLQHNGSTSESSSSSSNSSLSLRACYVATDEVAAVQEITSALQAAEVSCPVYALCTHTQDPSSRTSQSETLVLMTELSILRETTYFVGTFNSNLGAWVSVLRSCPGAHGEHGTSPSGEEAAHDKGEVLSSVSDASSWRRANHYAQSYGVDRDNWFWF